MKILVDMDSIVVDTLSAWLNVYNRDWRDDLTMSQVYCWDMHKIVKPECGFKIYDILSTPGFFANLAPIKGAIEAITELQEQGNTIKFATAHPNKSSIPEKIDWIEKYFKHLKYTYKDVIFIHDKYLLDADVLIDDKPSTIKEWKNKGSNIMTIAYPYNRDCSDIANIYAEGYKDTEKAWETIVQEIKKIC